ncbi:MAG: amidohydrolase family protein, partial [Bacteroidetes bacterium]|nr:amidohydrolase family protein [Bacteroidota bacterium]
NAFGAEKIMFGSDWPVCLVAGNYNKVKEIVINFIAKLSSKEQASIMGDNAIKFYNL